MLWLYNSIYKSHINFIAIDSHQKCISLMPSRRTGGISIWGFTTKWETCEFVDDSGCHSCRYKIYSFIMNMNKKNFYTEIHSHHFQHALTAGSNLFFHKTNKIYIIYLFNLYNQHEPMLISWMKSVHHRNGFCCLFWTNNRLSIWCIYARSCSWTRAWRENCEK